MPNPPPSPDRRNFLRSVAAGAAMTVPAYGSVLGSNSRIGVAFLGCGGRAQAHVHTVRKLGGEGLGLTPVAVCDVWDGHTGEYEQTFGGRTIKRTYSQGLFPTAVSCGLNPDDTSRVTKDYRRVLDRKDVDVVCIASPDHWHARMTLDALAAGKDVYVERPMCRTIAEAVAVAESAAKCQRVVTVGVQGLTDPGIALARERIRQGQIGPVVHLAGGAFRNDARGMWRFYRVLPEMNRKTIDWDLFLGHRFDVNGEPIGPTPKEEPFHPESFAQWRCERAFSGGPVTDLLTPVIVRLLAASGLRQVTRVVSSQSLFHETDGRTVPDIATLIAEFAEGAQLTATATTLSNYPLEEVIRGRLGAVKFTKDQLHLYRDDPTRSTAFPSRIDRTIPPHEIVPYAPPKNETEALWRDFVGCVRDRNPATLCPPDLAAAAVRVTAEAIE